MSWSPDHDNATHQRIYTDWYSITRLRQLAERRFTGDRHSDLFEGLKQTFLLFRDEKHAAMLGLTALVARHFLDRFAEEAAGMAVTIESYRLHAWQQIPIVELRT